MKAPALTAAIDVGTNSFHIVIASVTDKGIIRIHSREKEMVRLGEGSGSGDMKILTREAMERGVAALRRFAAMASKAGARVRAIGTSALREAANADEFIERAKIESGIDVEVVSGVEEGRLIYVGAIHALPIISKRALVIDIGGGSTETIIGQRGDHIYIHSAKLGAIRLSQRFFPGFEVTPERISKCREYVKGDLAPTFKALLEHGFDTVVGTSGTMHAVGSVILAQKGRRIPDIINGVTITRAEILAAIDTILAARTKEERLQIPGLDPKRSDIIVAGAIIVEQLVLGMNIQKISLGAFALREGIVFDTVQKERNIKEFHHLSSLRYETVYHLCDLYRVNMQHAEHVKNLALQIFDDLQPLHRLGDTEREILEAAALLHDVGYHISPEEHHKHSYYIVSNCVMPGFTNDESELVANVARYHRKSHPKRKHANFIALSPERQHLVTVLSAILRIAEGFDRRMQQLVSAVRVMVEGEVLNLVVQPASASVSPDIEIWGAMRRVELLNIVLNRRVVITTDERMKFSKA